MIKILFVCILYSQSLFAQVPSTPPTKRFDITASDGGTFVLRADALPAKFPPEWGANPVIVTTDLTAQNTADATAQTARQTKIQQVKTRLANPTQLTAAEMDDAVRFLLRDYFKTNGL